MKYAFCLIIFLTLICFAAEAGAVTPAKHVAVQATKTQKIRKTEGPQTVKFVSWKGNRLTTTAGTFLIGRTVKVVDKAKTRRVKNGYSGTAPSVKLIYKDRRLVKVIIR